MAFETCRGKWQESKHGQQISAIRIVYLLLVRDKVHLKKAVLDFWKVGVWMIKYTAPVQFQMLSIHMCTKDTCQTWEETVVARNSRHEGWRKLAPPLRQEVNSDTPHAIYLFAACIQLLYGKQGKVMVVPFTQLAPMNYTFCLHIVRLENRRTDHYDVKNSWKKKLKPEGVDKLTH